MQLYDTERQAVVAFEPRPHATVYVCGITPYDSTHLGHAATYLTHDLVVRRMEDLGHTVTLVRNFTDVDDSILPKARELGVDFLDLAETEIARFRADMAALETRPADHEPRATESIPAMVELLQRLIDGGHAYSVEGATYFDVASFEGYGRLSGLDADDMVALARERGGTPDDPRQRNPLDFVLWQPSAPDEPVWDSPVGPGRPGWHLECSAMATSIVGNHLDLHGGGSDLVYPHHECEIAQTEAVTGEIFVGHWLHQALVAYQGEKMSKSLGNLAFVSDLRERHDARAIRLALFAHHYRTPWEWFDHEIDEAARLLDRLIDAAAGAAGVEPPSPEGGLRAEVAAAVDDDLDTPSVHRLLVEAAAAPATATRAGATELAAAAALVGLRL